MYKIPKKEADAIQAALSKFQKVLEIAKARDLNESDTVSIISDMLAEIFGYDKYLEVTSEFAIRGTFCDLAIKVNNKIEYLIECKSIGTQLKDAHMKQAVDYGANQGVNWVILTNGMVWKLYKIRFEQPIAADLVYEFNITALSPRSEDAKALLYILHRTAIEKEYRRVHYEKTQLINPYTIAQIMLSEAVISAARKEIRRIADDMKLESDEISKMLTSSVLKRDLVDSEEAKAAEKLITKLNKKAQKKAEPEKKKPAARQIEAAETKPDCTEDLPNPDTPQSEPCEKA